jgi:hypothetical protein
MSYYDVDKLTPRPSTHSPAQPGYGSVAEYQAAGVPWVTGSVASSTSVVNEHNFTNVTKKITIRNHSAGGGLKVGFTRNGVQGSNFILVDNVVGATLDLDVRVTALYVLGVTGSSTYSVFAALTAIPAKNAPILTGSVSGTNGAWQGVG